MIKSVNRGGQIIRVHYDFVPTEYEPRYQYDSEMKPLAVFEGSADASSYRHELVSDTKFPGLLIGNPVEFQAVIFIAGIVDYEV